MKIKKPINTLFQAYHNGPQYTRLNNNFHKIKYAK